MLRQDALEFLNTSPALQAYAADTSVGVDDNPAGWKSVIDNTWRALQLDTTSGEVAASKEQDARLLLRYFALEQFTDIYAMRVDVNLTAAGVSKTRSQAYRAVSQRLTEIKAMVEALGYIGGGKGAISIGRITLDYIEPYWPLSV